MSEKNGNARGRDLFEDAVRSLDPATTNRLRLMRRQALSEPRPAPWRALLLPSAAAAAAVLAVGLAWQFDRGMAPAASPDADAELALALPSEQDAILYAWLGEAPVAADGEAL